MIHPTIKQRVAENKEAMIAFRRALHRQPELPWEEFATTQRIAAELDKIGIAYRLTHPTGVIAEIKGGKPGKTVALRADIDALPVTEQNDHLTYKSETPGKMHACGHDSHVAMLLTAAKVLYEIRDQLAGNVRLIFQPAEEIAEGALEMIKQGAMEEVTNVFGMHIWSKMPSGKISCNSGSVFASADIVRIKFKGRGGHGSMPSDCIDTLLVAATFVVNLQAIISRETDPLVPAVVTIGKLESGTGFNVIAEEALLEGTVRCFSHSERQRIEAAIHRYAEATATMYGAQVTVEYIYGTLPVINEAQSALLAQSIIHDALGEQTLFNERPTTGAEDFSYYTEHIPGCYALVGCGDVEKATNIAHHHGCFNVDEEAMLNGAELYAQYAWAYLSQDQF